MAPADFVTTYGPEASQVASETGIPADVLLAIPANETGWGSVVVGNAFFGVKGPGTGAVATWESIGGSPVAIFDSFRTYGGFADAGRGFVDFLHSNSRYQGALEAFNATGDGPTLVRGIHAAGYATDPAWSDKVIRNMGTIDSLGIPSSGGGSTSLPSVPADFQKWLVPVGLVLAALWIADVL